MRRHRLKASMSVAQTVTVILTSEIAVQVDERGPHGRPRHSLVSSTHRGPRTPCGSDCEWTACVLPVDFDSAYAWDPPERDQWTDPNPAVWSREVSTCNCPKSVRRPAI